MILNFFHNSFFYLKLFLPQAGHRSTLTLKGSFITKLRYIWPLAEAWFFGFICKLVYCNQVTGKFEMILLHVLCGSRAERSYRHQKNVVKNKFVANYARYFGEKTLESWNLIIFLSNNEKILVSTYIRVFIDKLKDSCEYKILSYVYIYLIFIII